MIEKDLIDEFLVRDNLSKPEQILKDKCISLDKQLSEARHDLSQLTQAYNIKQNEVLILSQQLEGVLQVIVEISKDVEESTELNSAE